jgi:maleylacetoacetate isomerase
MKLYTFFRSSAAYRVRIALNLKQLGYTAVPIHFRKEGGQHRKPDFLKLNPQGLLPVLQDDGLTLNQSMAILEYLEEVYPDRSLLPKNPADKAQVRALSQMIACEIHPLNNLRVLNYLKNELKQDETSVNQWYQHWVTLGFDALESMLSKTAGEYCFGDSITLIDVCLVPQVFNALRFNCDMNKYPTIERIYQQLNTLTAFKDAAPAAQFDAE